MKPSPLPAHDMQERVKRSAAARLALRSLMGIVIAILIAAAYCLANLPTDSAEFVISAITGAMGIALLAAAVIADRAIGKRAAVDRERLDQLKQAETAEPWIVRGGHDSRS